MRYTRTVAITIASDDWAELKNIDSRIKTLVDRNMENVKVTDAFANEPADVSHASFIFNEFFKTLEKDDRPAVFKQKKRIIDAFMNRKALDELTLGNTSDWDIMCDAVREVFKQEGAL